MINNWNYICLTETIVGVCYMSDIMGRTAHNMYRTFSTANLYKRICKLVIL